MEDLARTAIIQPEDSAWESWWQRRRTAKREARRVRRVVYGFELWSVLKVSLLFYLCAWAVFLLAGVVLWSVVNSQGYLERFENFILEIFNYETFTINGEELFRWYLWIGLFSVLILTVLTVVMCLLYNLISVVVGGIRVTVVEEETVRLRRPQRIDLAPRIDPAQEQAAMAQAAMAQAAMAQAVMPVNPSLPPTQS